MTQAGSTFSAAAAAKPINLGIAERALSEFLEQ
jgi:hypothetical protein